MFLVLVFFINEVLTSIKELGLIRKPAAFISTISDERGQELLYAGMRISDVFKEDIGLGGVVSLLWFKRRKSFPAISQRLQPLTITVF